MHPRGFAVSALMVVLGALLACKKKEEPTAPSATAPTAEPVPVAPATTTPPAPAESAAPAQPVAPTTATATATAKPKPKTDAGAKPSASASAAPSAKPASSASTAPSDAAAPPNTAVSHAQIQACCNALGAEAKKEGLNKNKYTAASGTCNAIAQSVKAGKTDAALAKTTIKAQLQGVPVPGACQ